MIPPVKGILAACVLAVAASGAGAAGLASHQAGYTVRLDQARDSSVAAVSGQIALGVKKVCDGWLMQQSGTMNTHLATGAVIPQVLHFSSLEQGGRYRFSVSTNGASQEVILGSAEMPSGGGAGQAVYNRPEDATFILPPDTLFPVAHTRFMIDGAEAGKGQLQSYIFEGSEVEGAKLLVAFISPLSDRAKATMGEVGGDLLRRPGWNFRLAYFDPESRTGEPMYEVEVDLLDNGVAPRWVLDYGTFSVEMKLVKIEALEPPDC